MPRRTSSSIASRSRVGLHRQRRRIDVDLAQGVGAEPGDAARLLDRRVRLGRGVDRVPPGGDAVALGRAAADAVQRSDEGDERGVGRGVLDDAAALAARQEALGQAEQVGQPVEHVGLEFGRRRRGRPEHALHAEPGRQQIAEDRRAAGVGREVGEERRVLPVRDAGQHDVVKVAQHVRERLAMLGRGGRQRGADRARRRPARAPGRTRCARSSRRSSRRPGGRTRGTRPASYEVGEPSRADLSPRQLTASDRCARPSARRTHVSRSRCCWAGCSATATPTRSSAQPMIARMSRGLVGEEVARVVVRPCRGRRPG